MRIQIECWPKTLDEANAAEDIIQFLRALVRQHGGEFGATAREHTLTGAEGEPYYDHGLLLRGIGLLHRAGPDIPLLKAAE